MSHEVDADTLRFIRLDAGLGTVVRATGAGFLTIEGSDAAAATALVGDFTIEAWVELTAVAGSGYHTIIAYGITGEGLTTNYLALLRVLAPSGLLDLFWEHGAGSAD